MQDLEAVAIVDSNVDFDISSVRGLQQAAKRIWRRCERASSSRRVGATAFN
jgi:hypothetical protein